MFVVVSHGMQFIKKFDSFCLLVLCALLSSVHATELRLTIVVRNTENVPIEC